MSENERQKKRNSRKPNLQTSIDLSSLDHVPPHNLDAERGVIGALLLDPLLCDDIVPLVNADDFYSDANRRIFKHLMEMRNDGSGIDLLLLVDRLQKSEEFEAVGGEVYLGELMHSPPIAAHAEYYARIVKDKAVLRRLIHAGSGIVQEAFAPDTTTKDLLNKAAQQMFELCETQTTNQITDLHTAMMEATAYVDIKMRGETDGIPTGFTDLDNMLDGMHPNELIILAARPSMGKTAFATNIAEHVAVQKKQTVLIVSLEMARMELALRLICSRGKIDSNKIRKNFMSQSDKQHFLEAVDELGQAPMFIDDSPSRTVSEIAAVARRLKRQNDLKLLIIDYLGLIEPENANDPRQEQVAKMARRLKGLAREIKVPILCLAQLNRQAEASRDNKPRLSHLRESGAIEQDADVVLFVHREEKYMSSEEAEQKGLAGQAEIIVAKQRNGPIGEVKLAWIGENTRFANLSDHETQEYKDFADYSISEHDLGIDAAMNTEVPDEF